MHRLVGLDGDFATLEMHFVVTAIAPAVFLICAGLGVYDVAYWAPSLAVGSVFLLLTAMAGYFCLRERQRARLFWATDLLGWAQNGGRLAKALTHPHGSIAPLAIEQELRLLVAEGRASRLAKAEPPGHTLAETVAGLADETRANTAQIMAYRDMMQGMQIDVVGVANRLNACRKHMSALLDATTDAAAAMQLKAELAKFLSSISEETKTLNSLGAISRAA
jgi:hypothetical protein